MSAYRSNARPSSMSSSSSPSSSSSGAGPAESASGADKTRYRVMAPVHREGRDKPYWLRLGTAFANPPKNGNPASISVKLDAAPIGGELGLFVDDERDKEE